MLTTLEVVIYVVALVILLPLLAHSLFAGAEAAEKTWFARYYRAQKYLNLAGNLFLLAVCASAVAKLGLHFGYIGPGVKDSLTFWTGVAFGATLLAYLGLWIGAVLRVRRNGRSPT